MPALPKRSELKWIYLGNTPTVEIACSEVTGCAFGWLYLAKVLIVNF